MLTEKIDDNNLERVKDIIKPGVAVNVTVDGRGGELYIENGEYKFADGDTGVVETLEI